MLQIAEKASEKLFDGSFFDLELPKGCIKSRPEDFVVEEQLSFSPSGAGEHLYLFIEKKSANTGFVADQIASQLNLSKRNISYAGLKDRHAITRQWFGVWAPGKNIDTALLEHPEFKILTSVRHNKKLRRAAIKRNKFKIVIRDLTLPATQLGQEIEKRCQQGVPKYFGLQRFGHNGNNLIEASRWLTGQSPLPEKRQQGIYLSAIRSFLFNQVLAQRIEAGLFNGVLSGDVLQFDGSNACFRVDEPSARDLHRLQTGEVHISGPLCGDGGTLNTDESLDFENEALAPWMPLKKLLENKNLKAERAALRMLPGGLSWRAIDSQTIEIAFSLVAGGFATALLSHFITLTDASKANYVTDGVSP